MRDSLRANRDKYFSFGERYKAALRAGQSMFHARAFLFDESRQLVEQTATESFRMTQLHRAPGTYEVVVRSTEFDERTPLEDVIGFWSYKVTVEKSGP